MIDLNPGQRLAAKTSISTRAWLACGVVAGPLYVSVTMIQALTREGFDLKQHRFTLLTTGEFRWIHQLNMIVVGALTMLLAIGVSRVLVSGRGASTLALLVTSVIIAQWFYTRSYRRWAWFYGAGFPTMFVTLSLVGMAIGFNGGGLAFLVTPWIWISTLAVHLHSREVTSDKKAAS